MSVAVDLIVFAVGAAVLGAAVRWWQTALSWRTVAAYSLATVAFFGPVLLTDKHLVASDIAAGWLPWSGVLEKGPPGNGLISDPLLQMWPMRTIVRAQWLGGDVPLWAGGLGTGQPLLGNAQSAPFAPLHLMALALPPLRAIDVAAAWQMLLALLFADRLARRLGAEAGVGASTAGAAVAAFSFAWSLYAVVWLSYPIGMAFVFLPAIVLGILELADGEPRGGVGLVVSTVALALSGHPETLLHAALVGGAVGAYRFVVAKVGRGRLVGRGLVAAGIAFALAAPALLPVLEALPESERMAALAERSDAAAPPPFDPKIATLLLDPLAFGSPRDRNWAGPTSNFTELASGWAGALPLVLAVAGGLVLGGWRRLALVGGLLALAVAVRVPGIYDTFTMAPGLAHGAHARLRLVWVLVVAILAGTSLVPLWSTRRGRASVVVAAVVVGAALLVVGTPAAPWQRGWWVVALASLGVVLLPAAKIARWSWVVVVLVAVELALAGARYHPPNPALVEPAALVSLRDAAAGRAVVPRVLAEEWDLLPNLAATAGLADVRGNDPMRPAVAARLVGERLAGSWAPGSHTLQPGGRFDLPLLDGLGIEYLLVRKRRFVPEGWVVAFQGVGGKVLANPNAFARFYLPDTVATAPSRELALDGALAAVDLRNVVVEAGQVVAAKGAIANLREGASSWQFDAQLTTAGLVVSTVSWSPGWRAWVGEQGIPVRRVGGAFVGLELPVGSHAVVLRYRPVTWVWSLGLAVCGAIAGVFAYRRGTRTRSRASHQQAQANTPNERTSP